MNISNIKYGFIPPLALILAAAGLFVVVDLPARRGITRIKNDLAVLEQKIRQDVPEQLIEKTQSESDSLSSVIAGISARIFPMTDLTGFGPKIQSITRNYDLTLVALKPKYESLASLQTDTAEIVELPISLVMSGKFGAFTKFADDLPRLPFAVRADEFVLTRQDRETAIVEFEIKGVLFLRKAGVNSEGRGAPGGAAAQKM
jgi:hypothetical protein